LAQQTNTFAFASAAPSGFKIRSRTSGFFAFATAALFAETALACGEPVETVAELSPSAAGAARAITAKNSDANLRMEKLP
jgi:hypothetical protein